MKNQRGKRKLEWNEYWTNFQQTSTSLIEEHNNSLLSGKPANV